MKAGAETPAPVAEIEAVAAPATAIEVKSEVETPVEQVAAAVETAPLVADHSASAAHQDEVHLQVSQPPESQQTETKSPEAPAIAAVNAAVFVQEPAPVDRADEPMFALAPAAVEPTATENSADAKIDVKLPDAIAQGETSEAAAPAEAVVAQDLESRHEEAPVVADHSPEPTQESTQESARESKQQSKAEEPKSQELNAHELNVAEFEGGED